MTIKRSHLRIVPIAGLLLLVAWLILVQTGLFVSAQGARIRYGETTTGSITGPEDQDTWDFDGVGGDVITVQVSPETGSLIPAVTLQDPDGVLLVSLESSGEAGVPLSFTASLRVSGPHVLTIYSSRGTTGEYALALELTEPGDQSPLSEGTLAYGRVAVGEINDNQFRQFWTFRGSRDDVIDVLMTAKTGDLQPFVSLIGPEGIVLASSETRAAAQQEAALFAVRLPGTGTYTLVARRAGDNFGETGTTQGTYELAVTLRQPGSDAAAITPVSLVPGTAARGRLVADAPAMFYSVQAVGVLSVGLDLLDPYQVATVAVMTPDRAVIDLASGIAPLQMSTMLPGNGEVWIEVSADNIQSQAPVDFELTVWQLAVADRSSRPLVYGMPQQVGASAADQEPAAWHFVGAAGDMVEIKLNPFAPILEGNLRVTGPDGVELVRRAVYSSTVQPLTLSQDGIYEIFLDPTIEASGYQIAVDQRGMSRWAFDQRAVPQFTGTLVPGRNNAVQNSLTPGASHLWEIDIAEPQTWVFQLEHPMPGTPVVLTVESPGGERLGISTTRRLGGYGRVQVSLPQAGRYQIVVFNLAGEATGGGPYVLWAEPAEGGNLVTHIPAKGVLAASQPVDVWDLDLAPGTLLNLRVQVLAGDMPPVSVFGPDGQLVGSSLIGEQPEAGRLIGIPIRDGGPHRILVGQIGTGGYTTYQISTDRVVPFGAQVNLVPAQPSPVPEVFVIDAAVANPPARVSVADQITAPAAPGEEVLVSAPRIETESLVRGEVLPGEIYQVRSIDVDAGRMLGFSVTALDDYAKPGVVLLDRSGQVLAERLQIDSPTVYLMHRFVSSGVYYVAVRLDQGGRFTLWIDSLSGIDERVPDVTVGDAATYGSTISGELVQPEDSLPVLFYGHADDVIFAGAARVQGDTRLSLELLAPSGERLAQAEESGANGRAILSGVRLPSDGVYRLVAAREPGEGTGICRLVVHLDMQSARASTERGGGVLESEQIARLSLADPVHHWIFRGESGEQVTVRIEPLASGVPTPFMLQVTDTQGHVFAQRAALTGQGAVELSELLLPRTGVYQIVVSGGDRQPGLYRVSLKRDLGSVQDNERALRYGETAGKVLNGRNFLDVWTFAGARGDVIRVDVRPVRGDVSLLNIQLRTGDGVVVATAAGDGIGAPVSINSISLPVDSHYSLVIGNPDELFDGEMAYEVTVSLQQTLARSMGSVMTIGQTVEGTFYADDWVDVWLFEGQQGDVITGELAAIGTAVLPSLALVSTDWHVASMAGRAEVLAVAQAVESSPARIEDFALPFSGPYALVARSPDGTGGNYRLSLSRRPVPAFATRSIRAGQLHTGQISPDSPLEAWTFEGSPGQMVTVSVSPESPSELILTVKLAGPDGTVQGSSTAVGPGQPALITGYYLNEGGTYTVLVMQAAGENGRSAGRYTATLEQVNPASSTAAPIAYGQAEFAILDSETPSAQWVFSGEAGDVVRIRAEVTDGDLDPMIKLYGVSGELLATGDDSSASVDAQISYSLVENGSYRVVVTRYGSALGITEGSCSVVVERVYRVQAVSPERLLVYGDRVAGTTDGDVLAAAWFFAGEQGDVVTAKIQFPLDDAPLSLSILDPAGNVLIVGVRDRGDARIESFTLPAAGLYQLEVRRPDDARSLYNPYTLELALVGTSPVLAQQGGILLPGQAAAGQFVEAPAVHDWAFEGRSGQTVSLSITRLSGALALEVILLAPDGSLLLRTTIQPGAVDTLSTQPIVLPLDGTYLLSLAGRDLALGAVYRLVLQPATPPEPAAEIALLDDQFGLITDVQPRQNWTFEGLAGEAISVRVAALSDNLEPTLLLWGPDGRPIAEGGREQIAGSHQAVLDYFIVPQDGTYTLTVGRVGGNYGHTIGTYRVMLRREAISNRAALAADIVFGQRVVGYTGEQEGNFYALQGLAGDVVALAVWTVDGDLAPDLRLEREDGRPIEAPVMRAENEASIPALRLPEDGRYIVVIQSSQVVEYTLVVFRREQQAQIQPLRRILEPGQNFVEGVVDPAQPTHWLFKRSMGEVFTFTIDTTGGGLRADVTLYGPSGEYLASATEQPGSRVTTLGPLRLPASGEYVLAVGAWLGSAGGSTGQYTVRMEPAEPGVSGSTGGHLAPRELAASGGLVPQDTEDTWTFEGQAGEVVAVRIEQLAGEGILTAELLSPDGQLLVAGSASTAFGGLEVTGQMLPVSGVYSIVVSGSPVSAIEYRILLEQQRSSLVASMESAQGIQYGESSTGTFVQGMKYQGWVFWGQPGEQVRSEVVPTVENGQWELYLVSPTGEVLFANGSTVPGDPVEVPGYVLPEAGFYGLVIGFQGDDSPEAAYTISLERWPSGVQDQGILDGEATGTLAPSAPAQAWTLLPQWTGDYAVEVTPLVTSAGWYVSILSGEGGVLATTTLGSAEALTVWLQGGERYAVLVSTGPSQVNGQYRIQFGPAVSAAGPRPLLVDSPNVGRIDGVHFTDEWQLDLGDEGTSQVEIEISRVSGTLLPVVSVVDANGVVIVEQQADENGFVRLVAGISAEGRHALLVSRAGRSAGKTTGEYTILVRAVGS